MSWGSCLLPLMTPLPSSHRHSETRWEEMGRNGDPQKKKKKTTKKRGHKASGGEGGGWRKNEKVMVWRPPQLKANKQSTLAELKDKN